MKVSFVLGDEQYAVESNYLDIVRLVAGAMGYHDTDIEPFPDKFSLRLRGPGKAEIVVRAPTMEQVGEKCLRRLLCAAK